jgi:hypothetical protein
MIVVMPERRKREVKWEGRMFLAKTPLETSAGYSGVVRIGYFFADALETEA